MQAHPVFAVELGKRRLFLRQLGTPAFDIQRRYLACGEFARRHGRLPLRNLERFALERGAPLQRAQFEVGGTDVRGQRDAGRAERRASDIAVGPCGVHQQCTAPEQIDFPRGTQADAAALRTRIDAVFAPALAACHRIQPRTALRLGAVAERARLRERAAATFRSRLASSALSTSRSSTGSPKSRHHMSPTAPRSRGRFGPLRGRRNGGRRGHVAGRGGCSRGRVSRQRQDRSALGARKRAGNNGRHGFALSLDMEFAKLYCTYS